MITVEYYDQDAGYFEKVEIDHIDGDTAEDIIRNVGKQTGVLEAGPGEYELYTDDGCVWSGNNIVEDGGEYTLDSSE
jgi:hypothetical protein